MNIKIKRYIIGITIVYILLCNFLIKIIPSLQINLVEDNLTEEKAILNTQEFNFGNSVSGEELKNDVWILWLIMNIVSSNSWLNRAIKKIKKR